MMLRVLAGVIACNTGIAFAADLPTALPAPAEARRLEALTARFQQMVDAHLLPGAVLLVMHHGKLVWLKAAGVQDLDSGRPMTPATIFQVMSMTKPITAAALLLLVERGKVTLTDPVSRYLPEFASQTVSDAGGLRRPTRPVSVRDLLNHTSGMSDPPADRRREIYSAMDLSLADAVRVYAGQTLHFDPGSRWTYSNTGYATLGRIIEAASSQPYEQFLRENLLAPLGMQDSFFVPEPSAEARIALPYNYSPSGLTLAGDDILGGHPLRFRRGGKYTAPEWGLYSTASDAAAFHQMMLDQGEWRGRRLLSKATVSAMTTITTGTLETNEEGYGTGLGWQIVRDAEGTGDLLPRGAYGHQGAFGTYGFVDRSKGLVGILMMAVPGRANQAPRHIFAAMVEAAFER